MEVNTGGDNIDYWYYGKALLNNYPYGELFHRSIRWGILFPIALFQLIFGTSAWVIYLIPIFMTLVLNGVIYKLGKYLFSSKVAFLSIVIFQFFPYTIRIGSQLFLALFSISYVLISLYFLLRFFDLEKGSRKSKLYFALSVTFLFIAYETKITNLYVLIPWVILLIKRSSLKSAFIYCLILAGLYSIEHFCYAVFAGYPMGRLEIILSTHFGSGSMTLGQGVQFDGTFLGLFERYSFKNFPIYWHLITWPGIAAGIILLKNKIQPQKVGMLLTVIITFMFILTFAIKSVNPFIPMEDFVVRYFSPLLPLFAMLISLTLFSFVPVANRLMDNKLIVLSTFVLPLCLICFMAIILPFLPKSAGNYLNNPLKPSEHNFIKTINFEKEVNRVKDLGGTFGTYLENDVFTLGRRLSHKSLDTVNRLFLQLDNGIGSYSTHKEILESGRQFLFLDNNSSNQIIVSYRLPFELKETTMEEVK